MGEFIRQIHITPARKAIFSREENLTLFRDLLFDVLGDVPIEMTENGEKGTRILVNQPLSEEKEARLREIWELTMPPAPNADRIRREMQNGTT